jgi:alkanesulfonate monooxygenase SsuD/methylene tetrahydromethanopterin reductase-like flavin-dependent oxidoreductase (luciferase family)
MPPDRGIGVRLFSFHLMPYPELDPTYRGPAWITCPNELFDPKVGAAAYNRYLDELILAEELGFDGVCVNEHHQNAYGLMPSPNLVAAVLARQTTRVKIAVIGNALPLYNPPTRVAEEWAMIDCVSHGRLIAGMVVGGGPEYYSSSLNPAFARSRFAEAHDLIIRAWTEPGPFEFTGRHYNLRYVNSWPRPFQQPHPEIWVPGAGSRETMEFVAAHRYGYMGIPYFHFSSFEATFQRFFAACERAGYQGHPSQGGWLVPIYVAETDRQARAQFEEHFMYFVKRLLPGINNLPPGYTSITSAEAILRSAAGFATNLTSLDEAMAGGYAIVGSPNRVAEELTERMARLGVSNLLGLFQLGSLPADRTRANMTMFAEQVAPALRRELTTRLGR